MSKKMRLARLEKKAKAGGVLATKATVFSLLGLRRPDQSTPWRPNQLLPRQRADLESWILTTWDKLLADWPDWLCIDGSSATVTDADEVAAFKSEAAAIHAEMMEAHARGQLAEWWCNGSLDDKRLPSPTGGPGEQAGPHQGVVDRMSDRLLAALAYLDDDSLARLASEFGGSWQLREPLPA